VANTTPQMSNLMSTVEAAAHLRMSRQRALLLARAGRIPGARKLSGCWVFPKPCTVTPPKRRGRRRLS
jgi:hypothetical protein